MSALLTNSRAKCARACPRRHKLEYLDGWRPVAEADELRFGTVIHLALAVWWQRADAGRLDAALAIIDGAGLDPFVAVRAKVMLVGYHARWGAEPYEAVLIEQRFEAALVNPDTGAESKLWRLAGKIDVLVRDTRTGLLWLLEHKTSGEDVTPGSIYWRRLRMDSQISTYVDGAAALGYAVEGTIYDVLVKFDQRPLKATPAESRKYTKQGALYANQRAEDETVVEYSNRLVEAMTAEPASYFARLEVPRLEAEMNEARRDLWHQAQRMREDERLSRAVRHPESCHSYGRACPFFDVCTGVASLDDERLFRHVEDVHPELAEVSATNPSNPKEMGHQ